MSDEPYRSKPKMMSARRQSNGKVYWRECQHILYIDGRTETCRADTLNGSHTCPKCTTLERKTEGFKLRDLRLVSY